MLSSEVLMSYFIIPEIHYIQKTKRNSTEVRKNMDFEFSHVYAQNPESCFTSCRKCDIGQVIQLESLLSVELVMPAPI